MKHIQRRAGERARLYRKQGSENRAASEGRGHPRHHHVVRSAEHLVQQHDVIQNVDGQILYSDFGQQNIGTLDPPTGKITQYAVAANKPGYIPGELELDQASPATHPDFTQESMVVPPHSNVDGRPRTRSRIRHRFGSSNPLWLMRFGGSASAHFAPATNTFKIIRTPTAGYRLVQSLLKAGFAATRTRLGPAHGVEPVKRTA